MCGTDGNIFDDPDVCELQLLFYVDTMVAGEALTPYQGRNSLNMLNRLKLTIFTQNPWNSEGFWEFWGFEHVESAKNRLFFRENYAPVHEFTQLQSCTEIICVFEKGGMGKGFCSRELNIPVSSTWDSRDEWFVWKKSLVILFVWLSVRAWTESRKSAFVCTQCGCSFWGLSHIDIKDNQQTLTAIPRRIHPIPSDLGS